jgi:hypothetical protein
MAELQRALEWAKNNPQDERAKKLIDMVSSGKLNSDMVQAKSIQQESGGVMGALKQGVQGVKQSFRDVTNKNADIINSGQSPASQVAQVAGQNVKFFGSLAANAAGTVAKAVTPDVIEEPIKQKFTELVQMGIDTPTAQKAIQAYQEFKQAHPEAAGNAEAAGNFIDFALWGLGAGAGVKVGEQVLATAVKTTGKAVDKTAQLGGSLAKTATSLGTGMERTTIDQIIKTPGIFTAKEMAKIDRESIFNKAKTAIEGRIEALSETGKQYEGVRKSGQVVEFKQNPLQEVLGKYGIGVDESGKIVATAESVPLGSGDLKALEGFIGQYGSNKLSANGFLNARKALSNMANYAEDKTDMAGKIARELRKKYDEFGKGTLKGLAELDAKYAPETKLLSGIKKVIFNRDGTIKDNAISKIANLTGKGKEQVLKKMEQIVPGITEDVNILKAIENVELAKGKQVGAYLKGGVGGFVVSGGNPVAAIASAIITSPQIAVPLIRTYGKLKNVGKDVIDGIIGKMKKGVKLVGEEKKIVDEAVDKASGKLLERAKNIRPGLTIKQDLSFPNKSPLYAEARKYKSAEEFVDSIGEDTYKKIYKPIQNKVDDIHVRLESTCVDCEGGADFVDSQMAKAVEIPKRGKWANKIREDWAGRGGLRGGKQGNRIDDYDTSLYLTDEYLIFQESGIENFYKLENAPKLDSKSQLTSIWKEANKGQITPENLQSIGLTTEDVGKIKSPLYAEARKYKTLQDFKDNYAGGLILDRNKVNDWISGGPNNEVMVSKLLGPDGKKFMKKMDLPDIPVRVQEASEETIGHYAQIEWRGGNRLKDARINIEISPTEEFGVKELASKEASLLHELAHAKQIRMNRLGGKKVQGEISETAAQKNASFHYNKAIEDTYDEAHQALIGGIKTATPKSGVKLNMKDNINKLASLVDKADMTVMRQFLDYHNLNENMPFSVFNKAENLRKLMKIKETATTDQLADIFDQIMESARKLK